MLLFPPPVWTLLHRGQYPVRFWYLKWPVSPNVPPQCGDTQLPPAPPLPQSNTIGYFFFKVKHFLISGQSRDLWNIWGCAGFHEHVCKYGEVREVCDLSYYAWAQFGACTDALKDSAKSWRLDRTVGLSAHVLYYQKWWCWWRWAEPRLRGQKDFTIFSGWPSISLVLLTYGIFSWHCCLFPWRPPAHLDVCLDFNIDPSICYWMLSPWGRLNQSKRISALDSYIWDQRALLCWLIDFQYLSDMFQSFYICVPVFCILPPCPQGAILMLLY